MEKDVANHLCHNYGTRALQLAELAETHPALCPIAPDGTKRWKRLSAEYPHLEAEVTFACRNEYACTAVDVLARRTRLAFVDVRAALLVLPRILDLMQAELGWSATRKAEELTNARHFLETMVSSLNREDTPRAMPLQ